MKKLKPLMRFMRSDVQDAMVLGDENRAIRMIVKARGCTREQAKKHAKRLAAERNREIDKRLGGR